PQQVHESAESEKKDIHTGKSTIHPEAYSVSRAGAHIDLTHREVDLLHDLARHIGQVMTREGLRETVWGSGSFGGVRTVDARERRRREKSEECPSNADGSGTRGGVGYYLRQPEEE